MSLWDNAVEAACGLAIQEDFEGTAYRLVTEQAIYASDRGNKLAFALIQDYERDFRRALEPLGSGLVVSARYRYACALPRHAKVSVATMDQTLLALVLRKIYDEVARQGQLDEQGEVHLDLVDLEVKFKQSTHGRDLPKGGELAGLMRTAQRWGIAKRSEDPAGAAQTDVEQPFVVVIRPAIIDVLGEVAIERLALFAGPKAGAAAPSSSEADETQGDDE